MAEAVIPVDLRNPGQVFACLGLMEAAEVLCGPAEGGYAWTDGDTRASFTLSVAGEADPVREAVGFLTTAQARSLNAPDNGPASVTYDTGVWGIATEPYDREVAQLFPFQPPSSSAPLPLRLVSGAKSLSVEYWGDEASSAGRDNVKFWGESKGKPGAAFAEDALALVRAAGTPDMAGLLTDPFAVAGPLSGSFRLDWRRDYTPLDAGFSPNDHKGSMTMVGYPLVELLAAIGLQHARPERPERGNKLAYRYAVSDARLPTLFARAVLGGQALGFNVRRFRMQLDWPGQEGQARCIIDSREE